jgi:rubrerythrin
MTSSLAYTQIARFTRNEELRKLVKRMAKDERRHQAFY